MRRAGGGGRVMASATKKKNVAQNRKPSFGCSTLNPKKLDAGSRTIRAGVPCTLLLRIEAVGFPPVGLLL